MLSPKQRILAGWGNTPVDKRRMIAAIGASRSGKSHAASLGFFLWTQSLGPRPGDQMHLVVGQSFSVMKATIWSHLTGFAGAYEWQGTDRVLTINGVRYKFLAYTNVQSETRPLGFTIHSLLADEAVLVGARFLTLAIGRCTFPDSKVWVLTNPAHPGHPLKRDFIDKGLFDEVLHFQFSDNPTLSESVQEGLRSLYTGADYTRLVEGEWAAHSGQLYPKMTVVNPADLPPSVVVETDVAIDPGYAAPYAALFIARTRRDNYLVYDNYYHRPEDGARTPAEHASAVIAQAGQRALPDWPAPSNFIVDPAAAGDCYEYESRGCFLPSVDKDVLAGVANLRNKLEEPRYYIYEGCTRLVEELQGLVWDPRESERGEDRPDPRSPDHAADALRYHASFRFPLDAVARYV